MAQILVRNLDVSTISKLKQRAESHGRSLESEARAILEEAARACDWREQVERVRALFEGREFPDSSDLVREDRSR